MIESTHVSLDIYILICIKVTTSGASFCFLSCVNFRNNAQSSLGCVIKPEFIQINNFLLDKFKRGKHAWLLWYCFIGFKWEHMWMERTSERRSWKGGVLSPTLFLVFINDTIKDMPRNNKGAIYAEDFVIIWCSEEHLTTAQYRLQQALDRLSEWTQK